MSYTDTVTQVGVGVSKELLLANIASPVVAFSVVTVGDGVRYTVEHLIGGNRWFPHPTVQNQTEDAYGYYPHPIAGIRVNVLEGDNVGVMLSVLGAK